MPSKVAEDQTAAPPGFKIVELAIDPPLTIRRILVPADISEDDVPEGAILLGEDETRGIMSRQAKPVNFKVGDRVRKAVTKENPTMDNSEMGTIDAKLKSGKFRVKWETSLPSTHFSNELMMVW